MSRGWIYIITSPDLAENTIKIGKTRTPEERERQVSAGTGIPDDFKVVYQIEVDDCDMAEKIIHEKFDEFHIRQRGGWFEIPPSEAAIIVDIVAKGINEQGYEKDYYRGIIDERHTKKWFKKEKENKINKIFESMSNDELEALDREFEEYIRDDPITRDIYFRHGALGPAERAWDKFTEEKFLTEDERDYEVYIREQQQKENKLMNNVRKIRERRAKETKA